jgi:3'(2'), 5'-bisphosphate nucleotidase
MSNQDHELRVALQAARRAALVCEAVRSELGSTGVLTKGDRTPVTVADFASQAVVALELRAALPGAILVAEESARALSDVQIRDHVVHQVLTAMPGAGESDIWEAIESGNREPAPGASFWTLDPLDGTKGYLRGDQYAIALARIDAGSVALAVLACPQLLITPGGDGDRGCLFLAVRGGGSFQEPLVVGPREVAENRLRLRVATTADPKDALLCEPWESGHTRHDQHARIATALGFERPPLRLDSQAKYGVVARGEAALYLRLPSSATYREKIWDHAAGALLVEEAGGRVSDCLGAALDFSQGRTLAANRGIVASNGLLHAAAQGAAQTLLSESQEAHD